MDCNFGIHVYWFWAGSEIKSGLIEIIPECRYIHLIASESIMNPIQIPSIDEPRSRFSLSVPSTLDFHRHCVLPRWPPYSLTWLPPLPISFEQKLKEKREERNPRWTGFHHAWLGSYPCDIKQEILEIRIFLFALPILKPFKFQSLKIFDDVITHNFWILFWPIL